MIRISLAPWIWIRIDINLAPYPHQNQGGSTTLPLSLEAEFSMLFSRMVEAGHTEAPAKLLEVAIEHRLERYRYYLTPSVLRLFYVWYLPVRTVPTQYSLFFFVAP